MPTSAYTPFQLHRAQRPGRHGANPKPATVTVYNIEPALVSAPNNILDNQDYLDTEYKGVEFTANKRFSNNWQMVAGLTIGKNTGGVNTALAQSASASRPPTT